MRRARNFLAVVVVITSLLGAGPVAADAMASAGSSEPDRHTLEWTRTSDPVVLRPNTATLEIGCSPTGAACMAVGHRYDEDGTQVPVAQRWDGSTWSAEVLPPGGAASLAEVDCSTPVDCVALETPRQGAGLERRIAVRSVTGWRWIPLAVARGRLELRQISCASPTWCVITGTFGYLAVFDGISVRPSPRTSELIESISCPEVAHCAAVSFNAFLEWDGTTWTRVESDHAYLVAVDCWSRQQCFALGEGASLAFTGSPATSWVETSLPSTVARSRTALGLDCVSDGTCHIPMQLGSEESPDLRLLSWSAGSWTDDAGPRPEGQLTGFGCRAGECILADNAISDDEPIHSSAVHGMGTQWARHAMVNPVGVPPDTAPHETTCPGRNWCLALGTAGIAGDYVKRWDGRRWRSVSAALEDQRDLDCWRPGACVVVGSDGTRPRAAVMRRGRWRVTPALKPAWMVTGAITGVGCARSRCVYSGVYQGHGRERWGVFVATHVDGIWRAERLGPLIPYETWFTGRPSMDCPTARLCVMVYSTYVEGPRQAFPVSYEALLRDGRWRTTALGRGFSLFEVDCADAEHCVAGGEDGRPGLILARDAAGTWRPVPFRTRNAGFYSVSCTSTRECYVAGIGSPVVRLSRAPAGWRSRGSGPRDMTDVACSGPRSCLAFNADETWVGR